MRDWTGAKVVIIGAARQGLALAFYLLQHGARVWINDRQSDAQLSAAQTWLAQALAESAASGSLTWVTGGHPLELLDGADLLCPSGGVPLTLPLVVEAQRRGIPLSNDSQIFLEACPCPAIGITGSAGKTTTTTLVGRMARAAFPETGSARRVWVGGNIGQPLISELDRMQPGDLAVVELSSFQLELMSSSPAIAAILNITPNHLDRHGTMEAYTAAKARILQAQHSMDIAVLGRDDPGAWGLAATVRGALLSFGRSPLPVGGAGTVACSDGSVLLRREPGAPQEQVLEVGDLGLRGEHNRLNAAAACAIAVAAGLPGDAIRQGVQGFGGVPHRLQFVRQWGGAAWYNDSIATAPERAMADIRSFDEPLLLLAGGRDKNLPWGEFADLVRQRVQTVVLFGEAAGLIDRALQPYGGLTVLRCAGLHEAVLAAAQAVQPGQVVLFSPGGTSFDEFKDFEERGECFIQWVNELP